MATVLDHLNTIAAEPHLQDRWSEQPEGPRSLRGRTHSAEQHQAASMVGWMLGGSLGQPSSYRWSTGLDLAQALPLAEQAAAAVRTHRAARQAAAAESARITAERRAAAEAEAAAARAQAEQRAEAAITQAADDEPATPRQIAYLRRLMRSESPEIEQMAGDLTRISKRWASYLIDRCLNG